MSASANAFAYRLRVCGLRWRERARVRESGHLRAQAGACGLACACARAIAGHPSDTGGSATPRRVSETALNFSEGLKRFSESASASVHSVLQQVRVSDQKPMFPLKRSRRLTLRAFQRLPALCHRFGDGVGGRQVSRHPYRRLYTGLWLTVRRRQSRWLPVYEPVGISVAGSSNSNPKATGQFRA